MKKVLLAGCCGNIGTALYNHLKYKYEIIPCDIQRHQNGFENYQTIDFCDYSQVEELFSLNTFDAVISLVGIAEAPNVPDPELFVKMTNTYLVSTFNILSAMKEYHVNKLVLASSNHVTDYYEDNGYSKIGREIRTDDYPKCISAYGSLKLGAESLCSVFSSNYGIQTICFRIGTYRENIDFVNIPDRWHRTFLTTSDLVYYFSAAIEKSADAEVYYLVSNNIDKPWDTDDLKQKLGEST